MVESLPAAVVAHGTIYKIGSSKIFLTMRFHYFPVRFENCPSTLSEDYLRRMLSRYELTTKGNTIVKWKGRTDDGKILPSTTYVARFANAAWARAAVREMQSMTLDGKVIKLVQYPKQLM